MEEYEKELEYVMKELFEEIFSMLGPYELDQLLVNLDGRLCNSEYYNGHLHNMIMEISKCIVSKFEQDIPKIIQVDCRYPCTYINPLKLIINEKDGE